MPICAYCSKSDRAILHDITHGVVPDEALAEPHCWKTICAVRGRHFREVDALTWQRLCTRRGYVAQHVSRGRR